MTTENAGVVVGIDLGTTNSEIAAFHRGRVRVLGPAGRQVLPSCVGIAPDGKLLVGEPARNQAMVFPERTVRSVKRRMGTSDPIVLADKSYLPEEISAVILRELVSFAEAELGTPVKKAVITVPAFFSDAQRSATRRAGELAGLEVVRILNEPTAASLAYEAAPGARRTVLVYDLGGGTFDVSIVRAEGEVTEVLASHGNTRLGGDDIDDLLARRLAATFKAESGVDALEVPTARARLWWAAEEAKKQLSFQPSVRVREEALVIQDGVALNFDHELAREELEELVRPLLQTTLESVWKALKDASLEPASIDDVLLVGGATRMPLVSTLLADVFSRVPSQSVHPDLCVALGAGVLASRLSGRDVERVLVDVTPYSFGPSFLGDYQGEEYEYCYRPVIQRNTALPVTRTERYFTSYPGQTKVEIEIFQGDHPDALQNIRVGEFAFDDLTPCEEPNEIQCRMAVDLDGILRVSAIEKRTGRSAHVTIANALAARSDEELTASRARLSHLFEGRSTEDSFAETGPHEDAGEHVADAGPDHPPSAASETAPDDRFRKAADLLARSRALLASMTDDDREEAVELNEQLALAMASGSADELATASSDLAELLFFVEGRR